MRIEFMFYVREAIIERAKKDGYIFNPTQHQELTQTIYKFSDDDYESVSNELTDAIESKLILFGIPINNAIRYSWKWSD